MTEETRPPIVMALSGSDPTGGAGIQADIETLASMGCHSAPVITAITVQDTQDVKRLKAVDSTLVLEQARAVLEDMPVDCFKVGLIGSLENIEVIHTLINDYPDIPLILDPVLRAGGGQELSDDDQAEAMRTLLLPLTTVLTPNSEEARRLAPDADTLDACAQELEDLGCEYVLITGSHENTPEVINTLYGNHRVLERYPWPRLPHQYHGSGCTLAASIAGLLAQGSDPLSAIHEAQQYAWESLNQAYRIGMGQLIPNRLFWAEGQD